MRTAVKLLSTFVTRLLSWTIVAADSPCNEPRLPHASDGRNGSRPHIDYRVYHLVTNGEVMGGARGGNGRIVGLVTDEPLCGPLDRRLVQELTEQESVEVFTLLLNELPRAVEAAVREIETRIPRYTMLHDLDHADFLTSTVTRSITGFFTMLADRDAPQTGHALYPEQEIRDVVAIPSIRGRDFVAVPRVRRGRYGPPASTPHPNVPSAK